MNALVCPNHKCSEVLDFGNFASSILSDGFTSTTPCCRTRYVVRVINDDVELHADKTCKFTAPKKKGRR